ncbi:MAG: hypothetical protein SWX82_19910 [Cyanobacteriota bacterium]|nr:hypothetical protein [Cyanobacteriota bacterium]
MVISQAIALTFVTIDLSPRSDREEVKIAIFTLTQIIFLPSGPPLSKGG